MIEPCHNLQQTATENYREGIHFITFFCPQGRVIERRVTEFHGQVIDDVHQQSASHYHKARANQKYTTHKRKQVEPA